MNRIRSLLAESRPLVMGILNTTPDSFSDGGQFNAPTSALQHALAMAHEGADIIDVGGESTRPGAEAVTMEDELTRVIPVIKALRQHSEVAISIDTSKPEVMQQAIQAGADMVNDVNALRAPGTLEVCIARDVPVCLMHMQGEPRTMQSNPVYGNVVEEVRRFLMERRDHCHTAGMKMVDILLDPGIGFGKSLDHNLSLLKHLDQLTVLECPVLVGVSRKSMIGQILDAPVDERLYGSMAAAIMAYTQGASVFRVHDVRAMVDALKVCDAIHRAN